MGPSAVEAGRQNPENEHQVRMKIFMRWLPIAASLALACVPAASASSAAHKAHKARKTHSSSASLRSKSHSYKKSRWKRRSKRVQLPKAPTPARISEIQSALGRGGYYQGDPNGRWDAETVAAMQKFQSANNLEATGKLDAPTLQKLGLGSDIAGVSAPKLVVPPANPPTPSAPSTQAPSGNSAPTGHSSARSPSPSSASNSSSASGSASRPSAAADDPQH
jgi:Putative peptidoglycan binding domain